MGELLQGPRLLVAAGHTLRVAAFRCVGMVAMLLVGLLLAGCIGQAVRLPPGAPPLVVTMSVAVATDQKP